MKKVGRRRDFDLVQELINYLKEVKGTVTQGELCSAVGINSETAEKWLLIFQLIKNECPLFRYGKAGRYRLISTAIFPPGSQTDMRDWYGIDLLKVNEAISAEVSKGVTDLKHVETPPRFSRGAGILTLRTELINKVSRGISAIAYEDAEPRKSLLINLRDDLISLTNAGTAALDIAGVESKENPIFILRKEILDAISSLISDLKHIKDTSNEFELQKLRKNFISRISRGITNLAYKESNPGTPKASKETVKVKQTDIPLRDNEIMDLRTEIQTGISKGKSSLTHVDAQVTESVRKAVLYCAKCRVEQDLPIHCGEIMSFEENEFICSNCGLKSPVPTHCDELMKIVIKE